MPERPPSNSVARSSVNPLDDGLSVMDPPPLVSTQDTVHSIHCKVNLSQQLGHAGPLTLELSAQPLDDDIEGEFVVVSTLEVLASGGDPRESRIPTLIGPSIPPGTRKGSDAQA